MKCKIAKHNLKFLAKANDNAQCGRGERTRQRTCDGQNFRVTYEGLLRSDLPCPGLAQERETCEAGPCPAWTEWSSWSDCSQTCDGGQRTRVRDCRKGRDYGECAGEDSQSETCNAQSCPTWTEWGGWTQCSRLETFSIQITNKSHKAEHKKINPSISHNI